MTVNSYRPVESRMNILSPHCLDRIEAASHQGIIFGVLDRRGHMSPYQWASLDYAQFRDHLSTCGPGDTFEIWSIKELLEKGLVLAHAKSSLNAGSDLLLVSPDKLAHIRAYLDLQYNEFISVYISWAQRLAECSWGDMDNNDSLIEYLTKYNAPATEVYVFPLTTIDKTEHYLVKARYPYPNE